MLILVLVRTSYGTTMMSAPSLDSRESNPLFKPEMISVPPVIDRESSMANKINAVVRAGRRDNCFKVKDLNAGILLIFLS